MKNPGRDLSFTRRQLLAGAITAGLGGEARAVAQPPSQPEPPHEPTARYRVQKVEGWRVHISSAFPSRRDALLGEALIELRSQLYQIQRVVPAKAVAELQKMVVWLEREEPHHPCMCYHVSPDWLREHGMNPEKAGGIEIANARNFLIWTLDQPWMVLHELAHGYHHQVVGYQNRDVLEAFRKATEGKTYESILRINGKPDRHYALTNDTEYFAELSESYFGVNDFYPYVRSELKAHDPLGYAMIEKTWGTRNRQHFRALPPSRTLKSG